MATIVNKMFNLVQPDIAVFGEKDYQQLAVIRSMVRNLNIPIEILGAPTVRASDGVALSSRNGYLNDQESATAPILYQYLKEVALALQHGCLDVGKLLDEQRLRITSSGLQLEYLDIRNAQDLSATPASYGHLVILVAAGLGRARLIDNMVVRVNKG
jgi:pantoate--beta-alanine ligase